MRINQGQLNTKAGNLMDQVGGFFDKKTVEIIMIKNDFDAKKAEETLLGINSLHDRLFLSD